MRDRGFIPLGLHQTMEPIMALVFIAAPFVLDFGSSTAKTLSVIVGVAILLVGMTTRWRMSVADLIPLRTHFAIDVGMGIVAIAAPFVLGFSDVSDATTFFVVMGVLELGAAFGTDWASGPDVEEAREPRTRVRMRPR
jgi:predicted acyltransferase